MARPLSPYGIVPLRPTEIRAACDLHYIISPDEREEIFNTLSWLDVEYRQILKQNADELAGQKKKATGVTDGSRKIGHRNT